MEQRALTTSDVELVESIRQGQTAAEASLYERYSARVYYLALKGLRSPEDAEDARAETFLRVLQSIRQNRLRSTEALASFILGTAHNVILETLRRRQKDERLTSNEVEREQACSPDEFFLSPEVKRAIEQVIRRLKPREQEFLRMYYYEELTGDEIARRLDLKPQRVRLIKSRALKSFREMYERLIQ